MKVVLSNFGIELTRRCNQSCMHCCRGNSENIDLTKETIDNFFDMNEINRISNLYFSGGEPTLNGDSLEYFVDRLIDNKTEINMFIFGINGLSISNSFINGLNKLYDYTKCGLLGLSNDQFHKEPDGEVIKQLKELKYFNLEKKNNIELNNLLPYGNAYDNGLSTKKQDYTPLIETEIKKVLYNGIEYLLMMDGYLSANGNICGNGCYDYISMDKYSIGNVNHESFEEIYKKRIKK